MFSVDKVVLWQKMNQNLIESASAGTGPPSSWPEPASCKSLARSALQTYQIGGQPDDSRAGVVDCDLQIAGCVGRHNLVGLDWSVA